MTISGTGTQADPWLIGSADDLVAFASNTSYWASGTYAELTANIDMDGVSYTPIGNSSTAYQGTFDGDGHVVSNLTISASSSDYQGLFRYVLSGTIQNVGCEGFNISGSDIVGGLVGYASSASTISNCYTYDCTVSGSYAVGGLVGYAYSASISNCYTYDCTVSGSYDVGGLVGYAYSASTISNCAIYGGTHGGTLVGSGSSTITNCYTSNDVTSEIFHNQDFWNANSGGSLSQVYLSWDFTTPVWYWDTKINLPVLQEPVVSDVEVDIYNGSSWVKGTPYVYNGSSWVEATNVFVYDGTDWKELA